MRVAFLALVALALGACLKDGVTGSFTVAGDYSLRTVNGQQLPVALESPGTSDTTVLSAMLTLHRGGGFTYAEVRQLRVTAGGGAPTDVQVTEPGRYEIFGNSVTLRRGVDNSARVAIFDTNTLTIIEDGRTQVYRR